MTRAEVVAVYPTAPVVPRNLLRLHIEFGRAMPEGASRDVRLEREATGEVIDDAFLPMWPELWDGTRRHLTLLLDPARIKRGLAPHNEVGYPLTEGDSVRVVAGEHAVVYEVGPDLRRRVDPRGWVVDAPPAGSMAPVVIGFDRPLDFALLRDCLHVSGVRGTCAIGEHETEWAFFPDAPWHSGDITLVVETRLEDLAGNSVARVFDRDLTRPEDDPIDAEAVRLDIAIS